LFIKNCKSLRLFKIKLKEHFITDFDNILCEIDALPIALDIILYFILFLSFLFLFYFFIYISALTVYYLLWLASVDELVANLAASHCNNLQCL